MGEESMTMRAKSRRSGLYCAIAIRKGQGVFISLAAAFPELSLPPSTNKSLKRPLLDV